MAKYKVDLSNEHTVEDLYQIVEEASSAVTACDTLMPIIKHATTDVLKKYDYPLNFQELISLLDKKMIEWCQEKKLVPPIHWDQFSDEIIALNKELIIENEDGSLSYAVQLIHECDYLKRKGESIRKEDLLGVINLYRKMLNPILFLKSKNTIQFLSNKSKEEKLLWYVNLINHYSFHAKKQLKSISSQKYFQGLEPQNYLMEKFLNGESLDIADMTGDEKKFISSAKLLSVISSITESLENDDYLSLGIFISDATFYAQSAGIDYPDNRGYGDIEVGNYSGKYIYMAAEFLTKEKSYKSLNSLCEDLFYKLDFEANLEEEKRKIVKRIHNILTDYGFQKHLSTK